MEALLQKLVTQLDTSYAFYQEFLELESRKYGALSENRLDLISGFVKQEEASLLKARGLERQREQILREMGRENCTMSELADSLGSPWKEKLNAVFTDFSQLLLDLKEMNLRCGSMAELRLKRTESIRKALENEPELEKLYSEQARRIQETGGMMSKKI